MIVCISHLLAMPTSMEYRMSCGDVPKVSAANCLISPFLPISPCMRVIRIVRPSRGPNSSSGTKEKDIV